MAFGISKDELTTWKRNVEQGNIAFITHYWEDKRFPNYKSVTKVGCRDLSKLKEWGAKYDLQPEWIHYHKKYPHFDLFGHLQIKVLTEEEQWEQLKRFNLKKGVI